MSPTPDRVRPAPAPAWLGRKNPCVQAEEDDDRQEADADERVARRPRDRPQQVDARQQQHDHPGLDQIAIDLLDPAQDRRRRCAGTAASPREERVAEGRPEGQHDCEDVQEERDTCSRGRRSSRASRETYRRARRRVWRVTRLYDGKVATPPQEECGPVALAGVGRPPRSRSRRRPRRSHRARLAADRSRMRVVGAGGGSPGATARRLRETLSRLPPPSSCSATSLRTGAVMLATVVEAEIRKALAQIPAFELDLRRRSPRHSQLLPRSRAASWS